VDAGTRFNEAKDKIEAALAARREALGASELDSRASPEEALDVTLPGRGFARGGLHPATRTLERIEQLFRSMGSTLRTAPRSRPTSTTSRRSISRRTTPRVRCTTRFI